MKLIDKFLVLISVANDDIVSFTINNPINSELLKTISKIKTPIISNFRLKVNFL